MNNKKKIKLKFKSKNKTKTNYKWCFTITFVTLIISFVMNILSNMMTNSLSLVGAIGILLGIVFIGIFFDILGTAVISSDLVIFSSMAANKVRGAKEAIFLVKNANVFSNIFNDVIGDTCGIISGATIGAIFIKITIENENFWYIVLGAIVAGLTVGGKALGKGFAIKHCALIVYKIGHFISYFNIKNYIKQK